MNFLSDLIGRPTTQSEIRTETTPEIFEISSLTRTPLTVISPSIFKPWIFLRVKIFIKVLFPAPELPMMAIKDPFKDEIDPKATSMLVTYVGDGLYWWQFWNVGDRFLITSSPTSQYSHRHNLCHIKILQLSYLNCSQQWCSFVEVSFESVTNPCLTRPVTSERIVLDSSPFPAVTVTFSHRSSTFAAPLNKLSPFRRQLCIVQKIFWVTLKPKCHQNYQLFKRLSFSLGWSLILILRKYSSVLFNRLHKFHPIRFLVFFSRDYYP